MITYSSSWMGPISTKWYSERNLPFVLKHYTDSAGKPATYQDYLDSYSCGRIDIRGLNQQEYYDGEHEYSLPVMNSDDWNLLTNWLDELETEELLTYNKLIEAFEGYLDRKIRWYHEDYQKEQE
jgi:hypothetical protein